MKAHFKKIEAVARQYTIMDFGLLKLCLFSAGVLAALYFHETFERGIVIIWIFFIGSWLVILLKTVVVYWDKTEEK